MPLTEPLMPNPSMMTPAPAPATREWDAKKLVTVRPGDGIGPLLQARTLPSLSPGQVVRRDLARYYLLLGADTILSEHKRSLLVKTADLPPVLTADDPAQILEALVRADAEETTLAQLAVPAVSPYMPVAP